MRQALQIGGILLACWATGFAADQKNTAASNPAPLPANVRPAPAPPPKQPPPKNPAPRQPQLGAPLSNPGSIAARLYRASPEERERALEKLPFKMQEQLRTQLDAFDKMPKDQQQEWIRRAERFAALPAERKALINQQLIAFSKLPVDRRREIAIVLRRLGVLPDVDRQKFLTGDDFKSRFSADEQTIIADLSDVFLPPM